MQACELAYRVIDVAAGDLGSSAARKFDIEAWVPTQGTYRELTSTSNCTTYQARRLDIRYRADGGKTTPVATPQWHPRDDSLAGRHPGDPSAGGRIRPGAGGAAAVSRRTRRARAAAVSAGRPANRWLIALDVDGTVLHEDGALSDVVVAQVQRVQKLGHEITLSTGRSVEMTLGILDRLGITPEYVVCANGAITLKRDPDAPTAYVRERVETFDPEEVLTTVSRSSGERPVRGRGCRRALPLRWRRAPGVGQRR